MYKKTMLAFLSLLLVCAMAVNLSGCATTVQAANLMEGVTPNEVKALNDLSDQNAAITDFAIRLFQTSEGSGKNTLVSPLSVLCALAMTANGAEEETLQQMEDVLGMTTEEMNSRFGTLSPKPVPQDRKFIECFRFNITDLTADE